jgi:hypothetical protein
MYPFTSLEGTFSRYATVMGLFEHFRSSLELNLLSVRYEDLVTDLGEIAEDIFSFLGHRPDEKYKEFHLVNREKIIHTPSRSQVTRALYDSSRYRWRNYSDHLEPYFPIVQPYLEKFGYAD